MPENKQPHTQYPRDLSRTGAATAVRLANTTNKWPCALPWQQQTPVSTSLPSWQTLTDEQWCAGFMSKHPWRPDVSCAEQQIEDRIDTDVSTDLSDLGARYRQWFKRRSTNHLDFGYLAWRRAGRVRQYSIRGPRNNRGLLSRQQKHQIGLYVLGPEEQLALLYVQRFSPLSQDRIDAIQTPTEDIPAINKAANQRVRLPSIAEQLRLAQLPQDSVEWGQQRQLSNGSSSAGGPSGWSYGDVYHLKVQEMRGQLAVPGFDSTTRYNFLHGHSRESEIRQAYEIVTGAWVGETGMVLHKNVWRHSPGGRGTGSSLRPEGHKHTSPDGVLHFNSHIFHNKWCAQAFLAGKLTKKGLLEIKAPGYKVSQRDSPPPLLSKATFSFWSGEEGVEVGHVGCFSFVFACGMLLLVLSHMVFCAGDAASRSQLPTQRVATATFVAKTPPRCILPAPVY
jgi:hypothetical protein